VEDPKGKEKKGKKWRYESEENKLKEEQETKMDR